MRPVREPPQALHLTRLALVHAGEWFSLPNSQAKLIHLKRKMQMPETKSWVICLSGEAMIDLPDGEFVRLKASEGFELQATTWETLPVRDGTVLMVLGGFEV